MYIAVFGKTRSAIDFIKTSDIFVAIGNADIRKNKMHWRNKGRDCNAGSSECNDLRKCPNWSWHSSYSGCGGL